MNRVNGSEWSEWYIMPIFHHQPRKSHLPRSQLFSLQSVAMGASLSPPATTLKAIIMMFHADLESLSLSFPPPPLSIPYSRWVCVYERDLSWLGAASVLWTRCLVIIIIIISKRRSLSFFLHITHTHNIYSVYIWLCSKFRLLEEKLLLSLACCFLCSLSLVLAAGFSRPPKQTAAQLPPTLTAKLNARSKYLRHCSLSSHRRHHSPSSLSINQYIQWQSSVL